MNFASKSAWVGLQEDLEEEEVLAEDLAGGLPSVRAAVAPDSARRELAPIEESPDELQATGLLARPEEAKAVPPESSEGFRVPSAVASAVSWRVGGSEEPARVRQPPSAPAARRRAAERVLHQQVDSNVVDVPLNVLKEETPIATGDPQFCKNCGVLLSAVSQLQRGEQGEFAWKCEFCGETNELRLDEAEVPKENKLTYVMQSAAETARERQGLAGESTIIFVVDTSGSMCVTQPAPGKFSLKTSHLESEFRGLLHYDEVDQFFEGWDRNTTYISRLQCVQAAIEAQILDVAEHAPERHVGLVTFSEEVRIVGDGSNEVVVAGDKLSSFESCLREVEGKFPLLLGKPVRETKDILLRKVAEMEEKGPTALGPAALVAIALAKEGGAGSRVILCTDGIANVGLGSLEVAPETSMAFYQQLAETAKDASVTVSVLSIEGEECKLNALMPLAVNTGGNVNKVDPLKLREDFANVLASKTVATRVEITVSLHKALKFRNAEAQSLQFNGSRLVRKLGTVCENESFIFEYCRKPLKELQEEGIDVSQLRQVPFQVLVKYYRSDGMLCVFSDTQVQDVTSDRNAALQQARFDILSRNAQQISSHLAMEGRYAESHLNTVAWGQAMSRNQVDSEQVARTWNYYSSSEQLYEGVRTEMQSMPEQEEHSRAANQSDSVALAAHRQQRGARR